MIEPLDSRLGGHPAEQLGLYRAYMTGMLPYDKATRIRSYYAVRSLCPLRDNVYEMHINKISFVFEGVNHVP
jgi:hypothetical protein